MPGSRVVLFPTRASRAIAESAPRRVEVGNNERGGPSQCPELGPRSRAVATVGSNLISAGLRLSRAAYPFVGVPRRLPRVRLCLAFFPAGVFQP